MQLCKGCLGLLEMIQRESQLLPAVWIRARIRVVREQTNAALAGTPAAGKAVTCTRASLACL